MPLSRYILDAKDQHRLRLRLHNKWIIRIRWVYLLILLPTVLLAASLTKALAAYQTIVTWTAVGGLGLNGLFWLITRSRHHSARFYSIVAVLQIALDLWLASFIVYFQGGLASRATILFAIPIITAGLLMGRFYAYVAAVGSGATYALAILGYQQQHPQAYSLESTIVPVVFYALLFVIIASIISRVSLSNALDERQRSYKELLAMLRHQLHNPSGVIAAVVEMLEHSDAYPGWPEQDKTYLQQLKRENIRLSNMITNVLSAVGTSNTDEPQLNKAAELVPLLNEVAMSCALGAKRVEDITTNLPHEKIKVIGIASQLRIAFDNVVENAFRYSDRGTPVVVTLIPEDRRVTVTIRDKGKGMTPTQQKLLSRLFSRLEGEVGGGKIELADEEYSMGLGLYVSKLIVERFGGTLTLVSSPKQGTQVTITLLKDYMDE